MRAHEPLSSRSGWRRRIGIGALALVIGATVSGDSRSVTAKDLTASLSGALRAGSNLRHLASAWANEAEDLATIGVLYGTVLSRMDPKVRTSILAAVEGVYEVCTGHPIRSSRTVIRCAAKPVSPKTAARCTHA
jgi:hypothetical protein